MRVARRGSDALPPSSDLYCIRNQTLFQSNTGRSSLSKFAKSSQSCGMMKANRKDSALIALARRLQHYVLQKVQIQLRGKCQTHTSFRL